MVVELSSICGVSLAMFFAASFRRGVSIKMCDYKVFLVARLDNFEDLRFDP